ncbi:CPBP family intramembrane glutamic endopeptidase [Paenarthrobacter sp. NPDC057355]|uniref:CPBP family intramembrane glutamic endopeptidase n=1 Tax=Paenarthrobacter sp. NPDC057355 TaxID=3346105 RepID=UPI003630DF66
MSHTSTSRWQSFWEKGGWWRAVLLAAVYFVLYNLCSLAFGPLLAGISDPDGAGFILVAYALPILVGCVLLVLFGWSVGWLRELFARQPIGGRGWMWIAVAVVLVFNLLRFATIDYSSVGLDVVATWLLAGLLIGFAEETLTRGFVIKLLRRARYRELMVAVISAAVFAGLHAGNLLSGQSVFVTLFQLLYTFAFGICMYLAYRLTGRLIVPILLHASTDPSIFLLTAHPSEGALTAIAGLGNIVVIVVGLVSLFFIRGRVEAPEVETALQRQH